MRVLIAEDNPASRVLLQTFLTKWGFDVISTGNGDEAFAAFQAKDPPQLALLDWEMPGMDGVSLCRKLKDLERETCLYLILLTARDESEDIVRGLEAGADDYMAKPYNRYELRARIDVGLRVIALHERIREQEKLQGVMEMAGAVCHEINQPLQTVSGWSELLLLNIEENDPRYDMLKNIKEGVERIGGLTRRIMNISEYRSKCYMDCRQTIVDIDQASSSMGDD